MTTGDRPLPPDSGGPTIAIAAHEGSRKDLIGLLCRFVHFAGAVSTGGNLP